MKRWTRYWTDPDFKRGVDKEFELAKAVTRPGFWISYAIHDPRQPDHIDRRDEGLIVHVGRSKQFYTRTKDRMRDAGTATGKPNDTMASILYGIMRNGGPSPRWSVLEEVTDVIDSMVSETNWTFELKRRGYPLVINAREHKKLTGPITRQQVDRTRVWQISVADAIGAGVEVIIQEPVSGFERAVDLTSKEPNMQLGKIRDEAKELGMTPRLVIGP